MGVTYLVLFIHETEPAVRVIRGTREQADDSCEKVKVLYDDVGARVVEIPDDHDDREFLLSEVLDRRDERLIDYAVLSDKDDWSKDSETFGLEQFDSRWSQ